MCPLDVNKSYCSLMLKHVSGIWFVVLSTLFQTKHITKSFSRWQMDKNKVLLEIVIKDPSFKVKDATLKKSPTLYKSRLENSSKDFISYTSETAKPKLIKIKIPKSRSRITKQKSKKKRRGMIDVNRRLTCGCSFCVYLFRKKAKKKASKQKKR